MFFSLLLLLICFNYSVVCCLNVGGLRLASGFSDLFVVCYLLVFVFVID